MSINRIEYNVKNIIKRIKMKNGKYHFETDVVYFKKEKVCYSFTNISLHIITIELVS